MIYQFDDNTGFHEIDISKLSDERLSIAYVNAEELMALNDTFKYDESTVNRCNDEGNRLRSMVEVYDDYTFGILHVVDDLKTDDDWIGIYARRNQLVIVDIIDADKSTQTTFRILPEKLHNGTNSIEKMMAMFFDMLCGNDADTIEKLGVDLEELESSLVVNKAREDFNLSLLEIKKQLQRLHYYFEHMLDIAQAVYDNENGIFDEKKLMYVKNLIHKVERLNEDTVGLKNTIEHLQDAYFSYLDMKLNSTMKILTVLSSIFFPLTIIVGWYGMNFTSMPELTWRYGYLYVIALSVIVVIALVLIGMKRKWFK